MDLKHLIERMKETPRPSIVCICGSTRYPWSLRQAVKRETASGKIVLSSGLNTRVDDLTGIEVKVTIVDLQIMHLHKIDMADEVLIMNIEPLLGEHTAIELEYARLKGKKIRFMYSERKNS